MKVILAYLFYALGALGLIVVIGFSVSYADTYGWDFSMNAIAGTLMWLVILVAIPVWIGSLFQRSSRSGASSADR